MKSQILKLGRFSGLGDFLFHVVCDTLGDVTNFSVKKESVEEWIKEEIWPLIKTPN